MVDEEDKWSVEELIGHIQSDWPTGDAIELMNSYATERDGDWIYHADRERAQAAFAKARDAFQAAQDALIADIKALATPLQPEQTGET